MTFLLLPFKKFRLTYALGAIVALAAGSSTMQQVFGQTNAYLITELSGEDAGQVPSKLNNLGDIAGRAASAAEGGTRATTWNHSDLKSRQLGALLGGDYSSASAINDAGQVAGVSNTSKAMLPFIWTPTTGLQPVQLLPGDRCGQANGINKYGHVAGYSSGPLARENPRMLSHLPGQRRWPAIGSFSSMQTCVAPVSRVSSAKTLVSP